MDTSCYCVCEQLSVVKSLLLLYCISYYNKQSPKMKKMQNTES